MTIWFVYNTDEKWKTISESICLYLQYCHGIDEGNIETCKYDSKTGKLLCDGKKPESGPNNDDIIAVPLFEKDAAGEITHHGLEVIKDLRKSIGYGFKTLFLVLSKQDISDYFHPENNMHYYAKSLLGNSEFGKVAKAVFLGEIIYKKKGAQNEKESSEDIEYMNIINLQEHDELKRLASLIKEFPSIDEKLRKKYYDVFVKYYDLIKNGGEIPKETEELLTTAQKKYKELNGMEQSDHSDALELFKAPIPFPLQELIDARDEIVKSLGGQIEGDKIIPGDKQLTLLLVDNKTDKFKKQTKPTIIEALQGFGIDDFFDIEMIGIEEHNSNNFKPGFEVFQFQKFRDKKELDNLDDKDEKEYYQNVIKKYKYKEGLVKTYSELIYNKIKSFHFILLDFFLNGGNTYLAFDFIKDIAEIKKKEGDYSTTWYFITSAVYDSVVKYSQSGLLAEYYESAVVNAGDDPTNKKRQIIFLYKLLTFINARLANFKRYKDSIHEKLFADWDNDEACNESQLCCKIYKNNKLECGKEDCLQGLQSDIKRYLTEYNDVCSIFYDKKDDTDLRDIVDSLDNVIKQFIWLPEADWYMIQHQIDFINNKLGGLQDKNLKKCKFSCKYIIEELRGRSEVY